MGWTSGFLEIMELSSARLSGIYVHVLIKNLRICLSRLGVFVNNNKTSAEHRHFFCKPFAPVSSAHWPDG